MTKITGDTVRNLRALSDIPDWPARIMRDPTGSGLRKRFGVVLSF